MSLSLSSSSSSIGVEGSDDESTTQKTKKEGMNSSLLQQFFSKLKPLYLLLENIIPKLQIALLIDPNQVFADLDAIYSQNPTSLKIDDVFTSSHFGFEVHSFCNSLIHSFIHPSTKLTIVMLFSQNKRMTRI